MALDFTETICGIATAPGVAGVGIIRISGEQALGIAAACFQPKYFSSATKAKPRYLHLGDFVVSGQTLDEGLMVFMPGPKSFTAENVVEFHCHGGQVILEEIMEALLAQGARLARPGEFTQRAFINGRIDLTQAEATHDMIQAKTSAGLHLVVNQLKGHLYETIQGLQKELQWILALVEAGIDFPEEDVVFSHHTEIQEKLQQAAQHLADLLQRADLQRIIKDGYKIALVGEPNVGKSSLLNALLQEERAIVTPIAGTTRDSIEESFNLEGIPLILVDTAGIRETADGIEQQGIQRSFKAMDQADVVLWLVDAAAPHHPLQQIEAHLRADRPLILIYNKMDLVQGQPKAQPMGVTPALIEEISAHQPADIQRLRQRLKDFILKGGQLQTEGAALTNLRQKHAAELALQEVQKAQATLSTKAGEELLSVDLKNALDALGSIVGETTPEDLLHQIFEHFCIGK